MRGPGKVQPRAGAIAAKMSGSCLFLDAFFMLGCGMSCKAAMFEVACVLGANIV